MLERFGAVGRSLLMKVHEVCNVPNTYYLKNGLAFFPKSIITYFLLWSTLHAAKSVGKSNCSLKGLFASPLNVWL